MLGFYVDSFKAGSVEQHAGKARGAEHIKVSGQFDGKWINQK